VTEPPGTGSVVEGPFTGSDAVTLVRAALHEVAPEADLDRLRGDEPLQEALDLDSIDFLNFAEAIHERTGLEVPDRDFPRLATLDGAAAYLIASCGR
jgi:acyl carrier protein